MAELFSSQSTYNHDIAWVDVPRPWQHLIMVMGFVIGIVTSLVSATTYAEDRMVSISGLATSSCSSKGIPGVTAVLDKREIAHTDASGRYQCESVSLN
jgi:hypothetical protein